MRLSTIFLTLTATLSACGEGREATSPPVRSEQSLGRLIASRSGSAPGVPAVASGQQERVSVNPDLIRALRSIADQAGVDGQGASGRTMDLNLFETPGSEVFFVGVVQRVVQEGPSLFLEGTLRDVQEGSFTATLYKDLLTLNVFTPDMSYRLTLAPGGGYVVERVESEEDFEDEVLVPPRDEPVEAEPMLVSAREDGSRIDVLILYDRSSATYWGGADRLVALAEEQRRFLIAALANSLPAAPPLGVRFLYQSVADGLPGDLDQMAHNATVKQGRDAHKADLVLLIRNTFKYPGSAYVFNDSKWHKSHAVSIVRKTYLDDRAVPHEIGHLLGGGHNLETGHGCGLYGDSCGRKWTYKKRTHGTLMAYVGKGTRVAHFSNPAVNWQVGNVRTGLTGVHNNARAIAASRLDISNYRFNGQSPTPAPTPSPGTGPAIAVLRPAGDASLPADSEIEIAARITDADGVAAALLHWHQRQSRLPCPGTNNKDWSCRREGAIYAWRLKVGGPGPRTYHLSASDAAGRVTTGPARRLQLVAPTGAGPSITVLNPVDGATLPADSTVTVTADIKAGAGLRDARLHWAQTKADLGCPSTTARTWRCRRDGDRFTWSLEVGGAGSRTYHLHATDALGRRVRVADRTLILK